MEIRKGPYGKFATEVLDDGTEIYEYAAEIIRDGIPGCFLPVYVNETLRGRELSFDISDLIPLTKSYLSTATDIRRKAAADLFLSITNSGNMLLDTSSILLNDKDSYWDPSNKKILIPLRPVKNNMPSVYTAGLRKEDVESFLKSPFFADALTLEEKDTIAYALYENNEEMLRGICEKISTTKIRKERSDDTLKILIYSLISSVFSLISVIDKDFLISVAFFLLSVSFPFIFRFTAAKKDKDNNAVEESSRRRTIFFEDTDTSSSTDCLILSYKHGQEVVKRAIYTDRATIGSDCFLSDITIDDPSVEALHLEITKTTDSYVVRDLSYKDTVMLDNHKIEKDHPYEIRDGQVLLCGNIEFKISRGLK